MQSSDMFAAIYPAVMRGTAECLNKDEHICDDHIP